MVLICISPKTNDFFVYLFTIYFSTFYFHWFLLWSLFTFFLPRVNFSFSSFLWWKLIHWFEIFFFSNGSIHAMNIWADLATYPHILRYCDFIFIKLKIVLNSLLHYSLIHGLFRCALLSFQLWGMFQSSFCYWFPIKLHLDPRTYFVQLEYI